MSKQLKDWRGFTPNQKVKTLIETKGADHEDVEHTMPPGTEGFIDNIERYSNDQGVVVTVVIWVDSSRGRAIVNAFDELDGPIENFLEAV